MEDREWRGIWIPKEVWLDDRLNPLEKVVLFEIDSLDKSERGCFASNEYIANFCKCSVWKVSNAITKLKNLGYIKIVAFDGRQRTIKSCIGFYLREPCEIPNSPMGNSQESNNRDSNNSEYQSISSADDGLPDGFAEFWKIYPRHMDKAKAVTAWKGLKPGKKLIETILADVKYRNETVWKNKEKRFILMPTTYIHGKRWEDEHESDAPVMPSQPAQTIPNFMQPQARELTPDEQKAMYEAMENGTFFKNMG